MATRASSASGADVERSTERFYDFIAVDRDNMDWVVEVKMDEEMPSAGVQRKRDVARRWANYVSGDENVGVCSRYLLVSETDVKTAKCLWEALKGLGGI